MGIPDKLFKRTFHISECEACTLAKSKTKGIRKLTAHPLRAATSSMDCWNADLIGPFSTFEGTERFKLHSLMGYQYILNIVDEYSRYVMAIPLVSKSDAPHELIKQIKLQQNTTGKVLKRLHSDGGSEFLERTLKSFLEDQGTEITNTLPGMSVHNGIVERMNEELEVMSRCLLKHSSAPQELWCKAMQYSALLYNITCHPSIEGSIPYMRMYSREELQMNIKYILTFGCDIFPLKSQSGKFDDRVEPGIFVGYSHKSAHPQVLLIESLKIISCRSYQVREHSFSHMKESFQAIRIEAEKYSKKGNVQEKVYEIKRIEREEIHDDIMKCLVYWKGYRLPSWESRIKLEDECPQVIKEFDNYKNQILVNACILLNALSMESKSPESVVDYPIPKNYNEALLHDDREKWLDAIQLELQSIFKQETAEACELPSGAKALGTLWVFTVKRNEKNEIIRHKARLVVLGNHQREGIDYNETFSPTVNIKSIKLLLALAAQEDLEIQQIDFDTAFLNAVLKEDIYIRVPQGYFKIAKGLKKGMVLKLLKALYGLKQAPREWNQLLDATLKSLGYKVCSLDECLYVKVVDGQRIYLTLYVDDTLAFFPKVLESIWNADKNFIQAKFKIKDMGECKWILNMAVERDRAKKTITLSQKGYVELILKTNNVVEGREVSTPFKYPDVSAVPDGVTPTLLTQQEQATYRSIVGAILYAANITRIDLSYIVGVLARYVNTPYNYHLDSARKVLAYLYARTDWKLLFIHSSSQSQTNGYHVRVYSDSSFGDDKCDRKSTSGWISTFNDRPIAWQSKKQSIVATSTAESELYGLCEGVKEGLFLRHWFEFYTGVVPTIEIMGDNQGSLFIADHTTSHNRTKHIAIQDFFIREHVKNKEITLTYIQTQNMLADILTKATKKEIFHRLIRKLMLTEPFKKIQ